MPPTPRATVSLTNGDAIRVPEDGYLYGSGTLTMTISEVIQRWEERGVPWAEVRGREVKPDGTLRVGECYASVRLDKARNVRLPTA